jgi:hypothetical protein
MTQWLVPFTMDSKKKRKKDNLTDSNSLHGEINTMMAQPNVPPQEQLKINMMTRPAVSII